MPASTPDFVEKLRCILELAPPDNWDKQHAMEFRKNAYSNKRDIYDSKGKKTGKVYFTMGMPVTSRDEPYPFSTFATSTDLLLGRYITDKQNQSLSSEINIGRSEAKKLVNGKDPTRDQYEIVKERFEQMVINQDKILKRYNPILSQLRVCFDKSAQKSNAELPSFKSIQGAANPFNRVKLSGFEQAVKLVHDNRSVRLFQSYMEDPKGVPNNLVKQYPIARANKEVQNLDKNIFDGALKYLVKLKLGWAQDGAQFTNQIAEEMKVFKLYLDGVIRSHSNEYITTFEKYEQIKNGKGVMKNIAIKKMFSAWKEWQNVAKGMCDTYKEALKGLEIRRYTLSDLDDSDPRFQTPSTPAAGITIKRAPSPVKFGGKPSAPPAPPGGAYPSAPAMSIPQIPVKQQKKEAAQRIVDYISLVKNATTEDELDKLKINKPDYSIFKSTQKRNATRKINVAIKNKERDLKNIVVIKPVSPVVLKKSQSPPVLEKIPAPPQPIPIAISKKVDNKMDVDNLPVARDSQVIPVVEVEPEKDKTVGGMTFSEMDEMDTNADLKAYRSLSEYETIKKTMKNRVLSFSPRDPGTDQGMDGRAAMLITPNIVITDTYFLEEPHRHMTDFLVGNMNKFEFLPRMALLKSTDGDDFIFKTNGKYSYKGYTRAKTKTRQSKIDSLWDGGTFNYDGDKLSITFNGESYSFQDSKISQLVKHGGKKLKYLLVQENVGKPLLHLATYAYDKVELANIDGERNATVRNLLPNQYAYDPKSVFKQLDEALTAMKNAGYLHRDVKMDNICLDETGKLHLIDVERVTPIGKNFFDRSKVIGNNQSKKIWMGDAKDVVYDFYTAQEIYNGDIQIDIPGANKCKTGNNCDRYQAALAMLNLGGKFELAGDYTYEQGEPEQVALFKSELAKVIVDGGKQLDFYNNFFQAEMKEKDLSVRYNMPEGLVKTLLSTDWVPKGSKEAPRDAPGSLDLQSPVNRVTIEYDSMSEEDIQEIQRAMTMYDEELERYDSESTVLSEQKATSLYDSSSEHSDSQQSVHSDLSEQKASVYDSSSENSSSGEGSDVSYQKYDSSSDSEPTARQFYDSSSDIVSETELDYGIESESEHEMSDTNNVPYNSDSDTGSI